LGWMDFRSRQVGIFDGMPELATAYWAFPVRFSIFLYSPGMTIKAQLLKKLVTVV
jgi:hypothetical protein